MNAPTTLVTKRLIFTIEGYSMLMKTITSLLIGAALHSVSQAQETLQVTEEEKNDASRFFAPSERTSRLDRIPGRHLDNARGYKINSAHGGEIPGGATPEDQKRRLRSYACNTAVFGLVRLEAAKAFVGKDDVGIFTKYRFRILQDWRGREKADGRAINLVVQGGEVVRNGEKIRIENPQAAYVPGGEYLLLAGNRLANDKIILETPPFVEVSKGMIYPATGKGAFPSGTQVAKAKAEVEAALADGGCK